MGLACTPPDASGAAEDGVSAHGDLMKLIRRAEQQGFRHVILSNNHHRFYSPDGETIVQCSSTVRDGAWWHKFIREMIVAGYRVNDELIKEQGMNGATTNLGDAMREAQESPPVPKVRRRGDVSNTAMDYFRSHPDKVISVHELMSILRARLGDVHENAGWSWINRMVLSRKIQKRDRGTYQWVSDRALPVPSLVQPRGTGSPAPVADPDGYIDADERELDEALAALGRIEAVVRKYKAIARQLVELKALINKVQS